VSNEEIEKLKKEIKILERAKLKAQRRREFLGIMICNDRLDKLNNKLMELER